MPAAAAVLAVTESSYFYSYGKQTTAMMTMTVDDEGNPTHSCSAATLGGVPSRSGTRGPNDKRGCFLFRSTGTLNTGRLLLSTQTWTTFIQKFQIYCSPSPNRTLCKHTGSGIFLRLKL
uniref:(northern house mosquito) hypothetical protein n=1 Tax=Culex pipiens TaxID=7175 RepID=A0A8D8KEF6_CULPI